MNKVLCVFVSVVGMITPYMASAAEAPTMMEFTTSVIGYEVLDAPAKGTGFVQAGDVLHLRPLDGTFAAVFIERERELAAYSLGKLVMDTKAPYIVARLENTHLFLTWDSNEKRFHLAESVFGPDIKEAANGGGSDTGSP